MPIDIEIYDEREISPETLKPEPDAEALALINELGLKAQLSDDGSRIAYPQPTAEQAFVLAVLFPAATKLEDYDAGCIPLRVLKEIRSYRSENPGHTLIVLHSTPAQVKDPVLIAWTSTWYNGFNVFQHHGYKNARLVARWGDALASWEKLAAAAREIMAVRASNALDRLIRKATAMRDSAKATGAWPSAELPELTNLPEGW